MLIIQFLMLIFIYRYHKLTIFHFLMIYWSSQGNIGSQHDICEPKKRLGDQLVIFTAILFMKYQSLRPSWSWSYYPNYHVTGDGNVALLNWPRLCVLSHNQTGSSSPSFVFDFVFVFCHTSNLVPQSSSSLAVSSSQNDSHYHHLWRSGHQWLRGLPDDRLWGACPLATLGRCAL